MDSELSMAATAVVTETQRNSEPTKILRCFISVSPYLLTEQRPTRHRSTLIAFMAGTVETLFYSEDVGEGVA